jgi:hypothetical protein
MRNIVKALRATRQTLKHAGIRKLRKYGLFDAMIIDFTEIGGVSRSINVYEATILDAAGSRWAFSDPAVSTHVFSTSPMASSR